MNSPGEVNFRFKIGDQVWVRDKGLNGRGYRVVRATVREQHAHEDRHPGYPNGEGYALDGNLWWDCYPGSRVFKSRAQALAIRLHIFNLGEQAFMAEFQRVLTTVT